MIFQAPALPEEFTAVLQQIDLLREKLRLFTSDSLNKWTGFLARTTYARAIHVSNSMEGINVTLDDAVAAVDRAEPLKPMDEDWDALVGYREALDYIIQLAKDPKAYAYNEGTILGLHYMMMKYDTSRYPGRWRTGPVNVVSTRTGEVVYEGVDSAHVPQLMSELITFLNEENGMHVIVKAAMAHLNLALIHPFKDGNGRMARALQTMVLSRDGILSPVFSSIEEYVGSNTEAYYNVLAGVGQGSWQPDNDALPWIRFCLTAHYRQATTLLNRLEEMSRLVAALEGEIARRKLPARTVAALVDAAVGLKVRNPVYRKQAEISDQVAKLDLTALVANEFLTPQGERRWRHYVPGKALLEIRERTKVSGTRVDPFDEVRRSGLVQSELTSDTTGLAGT